MHLSKKRLKLILKKGKIDILPNNGGSSGGADNSAAALRPTSIVCQCKGAKKNNLPFSTLTFSKLLRSKASPKPCCDYIFSLVLLKISLFKIGNLFIIDPYGSKQLY